MKVYDKKILGKQKESSRLYLVNWYYVANFGSNLVWAENEIEAKNMIWNGRKDIMYIVTETQTDSLPMVFNETE